MRHRSRDTLLVWVLPAVLLVAATAWLRWSDADLAIARRFFDPVRHWPVGAREPWRWFKYHGTLPAWILSVGALAVVIVARVRPSSRAARWRRRGAALALAMALGPGLVVNGGFKTHWPRPRPRDLVEFGGTRAFVPVWDRGEPASGASFPSGHAASAFYLFTPFFFLRRRHPVAAFVALAVGLAWGSMMGYARIAQGAHFLSDVVWSAGFDWYVAAACTRACGADDEAWRTRRP